jgi:capsular polysaccharide export protein
MRKLVQKLRVLLKKILRYIVKPQEPHANNPTTLLLLSVFERNYDRRKNEEFDLRDFINQLPIRCIHTNHSAKRMKQALGIAGNLFNDIPLLPENGVASRTKADLYLHWGIPRTTTIISQAIQEDIPILFVEGGFINTVAMPSDGSVPLCYRYNTSFLIDDIGLYFCSLKPSRLEVMLNSNRLLSEQQFNRARKLIETIILQRLTKYNHQAIFNPNLGSAGRTKVLVVDQARHDRSIDLGRASSATFEEMLEAAVRENPDADIFIKIHPEQATFGSISAGHYCGIKEQKNIRLIREAINPISLIQCVDKVYVVTSQMGMESLLCGKETHVFGVPFYSHWGLTIDRQEYANRKRTRSIEELFYITYLHYCRYVNPTTKKECEIEDVLDYLIEQRARYFAKYKVRCEL